MLKFRIISTLYIRNDFVIQPIKMEGVRKVGKPDELSRAYEKMGIDEIYYVDVVSSLYGRGALSHFVSSASDFLTTPLCVAGGIKSASDVRELLNNGADKVAINTAALNSPDLITDLSDKFGSQCIAVHIDVKDKNAYTNGGRVDSGVDATDWAIKAESLGAGEIILTNIDRQGTKRGPDCKLSLNICKSVSIPVIVSGGVSRPEHIAEVYELGASGVAMSIALHNRQDSVRLIKSEALKLGVPVRA